MRAFCGRSRTIEALREVSPLVTDTREEQRDRHVNYCRLVEKKLKNTYIYIYMSIKSRNILTQNCYDFINTSSVPEKGRFTPSICCPN